MTSKLLKLSIIGIIIGIAAGTLSYVFNTGVNWATDLRHQNLYLIYFLPFIGLLLAWIYHRYGREVEAGNNLILDEIHEPKKVIPFRMAPMILISAVISHLFGASVGREGTAVQMGAGIGDQLSRVFNDRRLLLMMGMGAGFGSIFQTPISGAIFALEVLAVGQIRHEALFPCLIASLTGFLTAKQLGISSFHSPFIDIPEVGLKVLFAVILAGIFFGLAAKVFSRMVHLIKKWSTEKIGLFYLRPFLGGLFLIIVFLGFGHDRYLGLGEDVILESFVHEIPYWDFLAKMITTAASVGTGFKGGEVMPLFFIGATLGNTLSLLLPGTMGFYSALGMISVFSGAANVPLTGIIMAMELFSPTIGLYAALAVTMSYLFSGSEGIYPSQKKVQDTKF